MEKSDVYLCSFADSRLQPTLNRLKKEAKSSKFFKEIFLYNEFTLDRGFKKKFKNQLKYNVRGYGYWIWKVSVILQSFKKINNNDFLLYVDSGCCINREGKERFESYKKIVANSDLNILAFSLEDSMLEKKYTKGDLFDFLEVRSCKNIYNTPQIQAGVILIIKNDKTKTFFETWESVFSSNFNLINDNESMSENFAEFVEHRHDQSIFSILLKKNKGVTLKLNEVYVNNKLEIPVILKDKPIWYVRKKNRKIKGIVFIGINYIKSIFKK